MTKARDLANAGTALTSVSATELGYVDGVTSAIQTQIDSKEPTLPSQTGNSGKYLTTNGSTKSWGTVSQYSLPSQTGNSGKYLTTNGTSESWGTVTQPINFTHRASLAGTPNSIEYNGSNLYVAVCDNGNLFTSPDGITWTSRTSGFGSNQIEKVAYGNGLWVAVGVNGTLTTSSDGITWTARTANMGTAQIRDVKYANNIWVAVGNNGGTVNTGGITYSTDGITWTRKSQSLTVGPSYFGVVWNGTNWIVVASNSTNNYLYASTPSGTWTAGQDGSTEGLLNVFWDGTRNIVITGSGNVRFSTSATLGTTTFMSNSIVANTQYKNYYYNGNIYSFGFVVTAESTTPGTGNRATKSIYTFLSPTVVWNGSGTLAGNSAAGFVGSQGYIISSENSGNIFTSF